MVLYVLPAARAELPPDTAPAVTSIQQFWDLSAEARSRSLTFAIEGTATYFDAEWKMLFFQDVGGNAAYVPYGDNPYPFKAGERIMARGIFEPPNVDIRFDRATIEPRGAGSVVPLDISGRIREHTRFICRFVEVRAYVDHYRRLSPRHLQMALSIDGAAVTGWLQLQPDMETPNLNEANIRLRGVYNPKVGPDGSLASIEIMSPSLDHLSVLSRLEDDPRFHLPIVPIAQLPQLPRDQVVRIAGFVKSQDSGRSIRLRDDSGQVEVFTGQTRPCSINESIEAVGYPSVSGTDWRLTGGLFRTVSRPAVVVPAAGMGETLRLAAQVLELPAQQAEQQAKVRLNGVVTWSHPSSPFFFVHDSSGGVRVWRDNAPSTLRGPGRLLEIEGTTGLGEFAPEVRATRFDKLSDAVLPEAQPVSLEHALTGVEEGRWVEMRGYLRRVQLVDGWNHLEMVTAAGDYLAVLPPEEDVKGLVGAVIRLHGVCTATANARRKLTGIRLWVPAASFLQVEVPAAADPFAIPIRPLDSLGRFDTLQTFNRRQKVAGVVLHHQPGHLIHLEDGGEGLLVFAREGAPLAPGDRIEAVGFYGRQAGRATLREAVYRRTGTGRQPEPADYTPDTRPSAEYDGRLVRLRGHLLDASGARDRLQLTVQSGKAFFEAVLDHAAPPDTVPPPGSELALVGVYEVKFDEYGQPAAYQLRLRSVADITVLRRPSWLTQQRILTFTAALACAILLFVGWVIALRRRVQAQTRQIREQIQREARLESELQRVGKIESLGLLAGGIAHDFNNLLTAVSGNISLARLDATLSPDAETSLTEAAKAVFRARDLTQQLLTFAKGGAPVRAAVLLPDVVREVAEFALRGSNTRCQFSVPPGLWPANVDKGQIGQVVQNLVINALQAMPDGGVIRITLTNQHVGEEMRQVLEPGRYLKLSVTDDGKGIAPDDLPKIFDPYYTTKKHGSGLGLATVHSIVKHHHGHVSVDSTLGRGATFHIWLPAAEVMPEPDPRLPAAGSRPANAGPARVLFMDDEESIRNLGQALLRRFGYEAVLAADGDEAIRVYTAARDAGRPFDVVILDLTIPGGIGGKQVIEALLRIDPSVVAIVSSGYSNDTVLANYRNHGFRGMVKKPYEGADLARAISQVLSGAPA